jgi:predicted glycoside hydrolase/deacetylase ChbG (UPF0249 family)
VLAEALGIGPVCPRSDAMHTTHGRTNEWLGYPPDARLLIVNADDLGMYGGVNEGIARAFESGVVTSTSLMVPAPEAPAAMRWLADHPEVSFGVHLTVVCDLPELRWGPLSSPEEVPSLVDEHGHFHPVDRMSQWLPTLRIAELEREFRAQLAGVLAAGLSPVHLDWHCFLSGGRADVFELTLALAREHGMSVRVADPAWNQPIQARGLPTADHVLLDSFDLSLADKPAQYVRLLRELPAGLSAWAIHPGLDDAASKNIDPGGWAIRHSDLDFLVSGQASDIIRSEGIILVGHGHIRDAWRRVAADAD